MKNALYSWLIFVLCLICTGVGCSEGTSGTNQDEKAENEEMETVEKMKRSDKEDADSVKAYWENKMKNSELEDE